LALQSIWYFEEKNIHVLYETEFGLDDRNYIVEPVVELSVDDSVPALSAATEILAMGIGFRLPTWVRLRARTCKNMSWFNR
jgi:hypothetical protein